MSMRALKYCSFIVCWLAVVPTFGAIAEDGVRPVPKEVAKQPVDKQPATKEPARREVRETRTAPAERAQRSEPAVRESSGTARGQPREVKSPTLDKLKEVNSDQGKWEKR